VRVFPLPPFSLLFLLTPAGFVCVDSGTFADWFRGLSPVSSALRALKGRKVAARWFLCFHGIVRTLSAFVAFPSLFFRQTPSTV